MNCSRKLIKLRRGGHRNFWFIASWPEAQVTTWAHDWYLKWGQGVWEWALSSVEFNANSEQMVSESRWLCWSPRIAWCGGNTHTHLNWKQNQNILLLFCKKEPDSLNLNTWLYLPQIKGHLTYIDYTLILLILAPSLALCIFWLICSSSWSQCIWHTFQLFQLSSPFIRK